MRLDSFPASIFILIMDGFECYFFTNTKTMANIINSLWIGVLFVLFLIKFVHGLKVLKFSYAEGFFILLYFNLHTEELCLKCVVSLCRWKNAINLWNYMTIWDVVTCSVQNYCFHSFISLTCLWYWKILLHKVNLKKHRHKR